MIRSIPNKLFLITSVFLLSLTIAFAAPCSPVNTILKLDTLAGGQAELYDQNFYSNPLCFGYTGREDTSSVHECADYKPLTRTWAPDPSSPDNLILKLSDVSNAHGATQDSGSSYSINVCYKGYRNCESVSGSCPSGKTPVVELSNPDDAHLASPLYSDFLSPITICCTPLSGVSCGSGDAATDQACTNNCQCTSGYCTAGTCSSCPGQTHLSSGQSCTHPCQCTSADCTAGTCIGSGTGSGGETPTITPCSSPIDCPSGERCQIDPGLFTGVCVSSSLCSASISNGNTCTRSCECVSGTCSQGRCVTSCSSSHPREQGSCAPGQVCATTYIPHCQACTPPTQRANSASCTDNCQCTSGLCSQGQCAGCTTSTVGEEGNCPAGEVCTAPQNGICNRCLSQFAADHTCQQNCECSSGTCTAGTCIGSGTGSGGGTPTTPSCSATLADDTSCTDSCQCTSSYCDSGTCKHRTCNPTTPTSSCPHPQVCSTQGVCDNPCVFNCPCTSGSQCESARCTSDSDHNGINNCDLDLTCPSGSEDPQDTDGDGILCDFCKNQGGTVNTLGCPITNQPHPLSCPDLKGVTCSDTGQCDGKEIPLREAHTLNLHEIYCCAPTPTQPTPVCEEHTHNPLLGRSITITRGTCEVEPGQTTGTRKITLLGINTGEIETAGGISAVLPECQTRTCTTSTSSSSTGSNSEWQVSCTTFTSEDTEKQTIPFYTISGILLSLAVLLGFYIAKKQKF